MRPLEAVNNIQRTVFLWKPPLWAMGVGHALHAFAQRVGFHKKTNRSTGLTKTCEVQTSSCQINQSKANHAQLLVRLRPPTPDEQSGVIVTLPRVRISPSPTVNTTAFCYLFCSNPCFIFSSCSHHVATFPRFSVRLARACALMCQRPTLSACWPALSLGLITNSLICVGKSVVLSSAANRLRKSRKRSGWSI